MIVRRRRVALRPPGELRDPRPSDREDNAAWLGEDSVLEQSRGWQRRASLGESASTAGTSKRERTEGLMGGGERSDLSL